MIGTRWPGRTRPWSRSPWRAVRAARGTAAACSKLRFGRLGAQDALGDAGVLGERALVDVGEDLIAGPEPGDGPADRLDPPGHVAAQVAVPGPSQPDRAQDVRQAPQEVPVARVDRGRVDPGQDLVVGRHRPLDLLQLEHVGPAVPVVGDRCSCRPSPRWPRCTPTRRRPSGGGCCRAGPCCATRAASRVRSPGPTRPGRGRLHGLDDRDVRAGGFSIDTDPPRHARHGTPPARSQELFQEGTDLSPDMDRRRSRPWPAPTPRHRDGVTAIRHDAAGS